ncbi:Hypothetical predicted protein [Mytilus galloprovincialis]|uniref:Uncharacterized protein n=1 Tax=Mytilus galloprovincialis TaxID=29158 RepID=A0A8B6E9I5_MYTGA|nr:Hypothetical predicted protein [Mytilus galloprovincialis]
MPPKRQSSYGVAGAIKKMKTAAQRKKTSTAIQSGPSIPPNNITVISPDVMEELTNRVTERVASRMERRMEEIFDKIASKNNGNSDVQAAEVQSHVDNLNRNIQGNGEQNNDSNNEVVSPEVLAVQPNVDKQIVGGQSAFLNVLGDLNARTANMNDFVKNDKLHDSDLDRVGDLFTYVANEALSCRNNPDAGTNDYGTKLLYLCKSSGLKKWAPP